MGGGHDRLLAAQLFAPRIPPGRTLGCYPRLCGLLMTTGCEVFKVPKITPSLLSHGVLERSTALQKTFLTSSDIAMHFVLWKSHEHRALRHIPLVITVGIRDTTRTGVLAAVN